MNIVLGVLDIILVLAGVVFAILEWSGITHTSFVAVGILWLVLAFSALDRISSR